MFDVINQLLSTRCHCPSIIVIVTSHEQPQKNATELPTRIKGRRWSTFCSTFKHLSFSLTVTANAFWSEIVFYTFWKEWGDLMDRTTSWV